MERKNNRLWTLLEATFYREGVTCRLHGEKDDEGKLNALPILS